MVGTVIFHAEEAARDPEPIAPAITSISRLLYGQAPDAGNNLNHQLLRRNNHARCDVMTSDATYPHIPFPAPVETVMRSIADKIAARAHPQQLGIVRFRKPGHRSGPQDAVHRGRSRARTCPTA